jgi:hypothetical protein
MYTRRSDISNFLIHFVHHRQWWDGEFPEPIAYDDQGKGVYDPWADYYTTHPIQADTSAFEILLRILDDGHLKVSWVYRKGKRTVYGPRGVVCFTEMPLYSMLNYVAERNDKYAVSSYGIAFLKRELFNVGARPVIYGTSAKFSFANPGDPYYLKDCRSLATQCGLSPYEQYRYVPMYESFGQFKEWSHEREWRWTADPTSLSQMPGVAIWLEQTIPVVSQPIIIVPSTDEANRFLNKLKEYYDAGQNSRGMRFDSKLLLNTRVLPLDKIDVSKLSTLRIDDLIFEQLPRIMQVSPSVGTLENVKSAFTNAQRFAKERTEEFKKSYPWEELGKTHFPPSIRAHVVTFQSHTDATEALLRLGLARPTGGLGYILPEITAGIKTEELADIEMVAAGAAAEALSSTLGQEFSVMIDDGWMFY